MPSLDEIREQQRQTWDKFSAGWKKHDEMVMAWVAAVTNELLASAQLSPAANVLDVAAGTGEPGLTAAPKVAKVTVTDLSERMLAVANEKAARLGIRNFETRACDAGALPFDDASFDVVLCRFGFMFFPDVATSVREFARVAKPGARVCAAVWGPPEKNPWATMIMSTIAKHVEMPTPPPGAPGLFRCAAPGFMSAAFREAGLSKVTEKEISGENRIGAEDYFTFMSEIAAPVVAGLAKADAPTREIIKREVIELARKTEQNGQARLAWSAVTVCGVK